MSTWHTVGELKHRPIAQTRDEPSEALVHHALVRRTVQALRMVGSLELGTFLSKRSGEQISRLDLVIARASNVSVWSGTRWDSP